MISDETFNAGEPFTITISLIPSKLSALPDFPCVTHVAPLITPVFPLQKYPPRQLHFLASNAYAASRPIVAGVAPGIAGGGIAGGGVAGGGVAGGGVAGGGVAGGGVAGGGDPVVAPYS